jgi:SM-20-related protein
VTTLSQVPVRAAAGLPQRAIKQVLAKTGRVHIPQFFADATATAIHQTLVRDTAWQLSLNPSGRHMDLGVDSLDKLPESERLQLMEAIQTGARNGFRYLFNNFPIYDLYLAGAHREHYLMRVFEYLNSEPFLEFARDVTGERDIAFADAQATLYRSGHFLTAHDDQVAGKQRRAAYVLSFTPTWRADWGGVLQFIDADGHVAEGYTPAFNALNLLCVPQMHSVSYVTPAAVGGRYSITGWLRAGDPL